LHTSEVKLSLEASGFGMRSQIIWAKDRFAFSRGHYHWQHEPCWYAVRGTSGAHWSGNRKQSTVWTIDAREDDGHGHGTQKPVECMRRPIENNSSPGQIAAKNSDLADIRSQKPVKHSGPEGACAPGDQKYLVFQSRFSRKRITSKGLTSIQNASLCGAKRHNGWLEYRVACGYGATILFPIYWRAMHEGENFRPHLYVR
jgi:hypothetical protein